MLLRVVLQARLGIEQRIERMVELGDVMGQHEVARLIQAVPQIEGSDEGFECIGKHRRVFGAAGAAHSGPETKQSGKAEAPRRLRERRVVDDGGLTQGQRALGFFGKLFVEPRRGDASENRVAQKLHSLVGTAAALFCIALMDERLLEEGWDRPLDGCRRDAAGPASAAGTLRRS